MKAQVQPNLLDRVVGYFAPERAARRTRARMSTLEPDLTRSYDPIYHFSDVAPGSDHLRLSLRLQRQQGSYRMTFTRLWPTL